jgi:hypothetical protein
MAELPRNKLLPACSYVSGELRKPPGSANAAVYNSDWCLSLNHGLLARLG